MPVAETVVEIVLAILLLLTIAWCAVVHHRLRKLMTDQGEVAAFVRSLTEATGRAELAVAEMRAAGEEAQAALIEHQEATRRQHEELERLLESGNRIARRLETGIVQGAKRMAEVRTRNDAAEPELVSAEALDRSAATAESAPSEQAPPKRQIGEDLMKALRALR